MCCPGPRRPHPAPPARPAYMLLARLHRVLAWLPSQHPPCAGPALIPTVTALLVCDRLSFALLQLGDEPAPDTTLPPVRIATGGRDAIGRPAVARDARRPSVMPLRVMSASSCSPPHSLPRPLPGPFKTRAPVRGFRPAGTGLAGLKVCGV